jgi:hypothetical protein
VNAGQTVPESASEFASMTRDELLTLVASSSNALQLARAGMEQQCQVPVSYTKEYITTDVAKLPRLKLLAQALAAEGRLAELENRPADAARSYLDTVDLGIACSHGAVLIDALVAVAMESIGTRSLETLMNSLDAASCRDIAARLETLDAGRESWKNISQQERDWMRGAQPVTGRFEEIFKGGLLRATQQSVEKRFYTQVTRTRRLMIDFAARAYELEHQQKPKNFADLVPACLKAIPQDPLSGTNMTFQP